MNNPIETLEGLVVVAVPDGCKGVVAVTPGGVWYLLELGGMPDTVTIHRAVARAFNQAALGRPEGTES